MFRVIQLFLLLVSFPIQSLAQDTTLIVVGSEPVAKIVQMLTGSEIEVKTIELSGGCAHHHHARPSDRRLVESADMVIYVSRDYENFLHKLAGNNQQQVLEIESLGQVDFTYEGIKNYHFWLDLAKTQQVVDLLSDQLKQTYPQYAKQIAENQLAAMEMFSELNELKVEAMSKQEKVVNLSGAALPFFVGAETVGHHLLAKHPSLKYTKELEQLIAGNYKCYILDIEQDLNIVRKYNLPYTQLSIDNWHEYKGYKEAYLDLINKYSECGE